MNDTLVLVYTIIITILSFSFAYFNGGGRSNRSQEPTQEQPQPQQTQQPQQPQQPNELPQPTPPPPTQHTGGFSLHKRSGIKNIFLLFGILLLGVLNIFKIFRINITK
jgi:hypothetical protein